MGMECLTLRELPPPAIIITGNNLLKEIISAVEIRFSLNTVTFHQHMPVVSTLVYSGVEIIYRRVIHCPLRDRNFDVERIML